MGNDLRLEQRMSVVDMAHFSNVWHLLCICSYTICVLWANRVLVADLENRSTPIDKSSTIFPGVVGEKVPPTDLV